MRLPVRSESEAFRLVVAGVLAIAVVVLIGWLTAPLVGAGVLVLILLAAVIAYARAANPDRRASLRTAAQEHHPHGSNGRGRHVLVIANETLAGSTLREQIVGRGREPVELDVLAPVLSSRVHYGVSDIDRERERAEARLRSSLQWAREHGISARGAVGDVNVLSAIEDELRDFGAAEVIVLTGPPETQTWQERDELERLRDELEVRITHIVNDGGGGAGPEASTSIP
jgi:hypothetical protein